MIINLKVIGVIPENGRICSRKGSIYIDSPSTFQALKRWFCSDSREYSVEIIRSIIFASINIYKVSTDQFTKKTIYTGITASKTGISNLKVTYSDDASLCAILNHLLLIISHFVENNASEEYDDEEK